MQGVDASAALRQLLVAASAPPSPTELTGLPRAIAGFRAVQRLRSGHPQRADPANSQAGSGHQHTSARLARAGP
ncbi:MAG: hypothetical protein QOI26_305 [Pseudonocardiales bacterium]|nr:hypothetical protein [Pseudonocardiales bacterium]